MARITGLSSRAIIGRFFERLVANPYAQIISRLAMRFDSDQESETYKWLGMAPAPREWVGERLARGLRTNGMTILNKTFENTLEIAVEDLRRDKTGQILVRIDEMAARVAAHPWKMLSTLIANGAGATSGLAYDGQYYFDSDHSEGSSGTLLNTLAAAQVTQLDVTTATAPTESEMAKAILGVIAYMMGIKDDQGEPMNDLAREFLVIVPVPLFPAALAATTLRVVAGASGASTDNPLLAGGGGGPFRVDVICDPRQTWTANFGVFRTDGNAKPFIVQEEEPLTIQALAEGSDIEFQKNAHQYGVKWCGNVGYGLWQHAALALLS
jgi:phage major head subunit gpT-like protein